MAGLLRSIRQVNRIGYADIAEPFAGGAGAALSLLLGEDTGRVHLNDLDHAIYSMWWTLTNRPQPFLDLIESTPVTMDEWHRQRAIYRSAPSRASKLRRGFAAFYLNRCNRSGIIINGGPIGGKEQVGRWKLDARFNRADLRARCQVIAEQSGRIAVYRQDGIEFIRSMDRPDVMLFVDPPYFEKGSLLYLNLLDADYHQRLAECLRTLQHATWVLTYDDCPEIRALYKDWANIRPFTLRYAARERRQGKEVFITPKALRLPKTQVSEAIVW